MKKTLLFCFLLASCASTNQPKGTYKTEENAPKFSNTRTFKDAPKDVMAAAKATLEDLTRESDPPATKKLAISSDSVETGWVYGKAKDKYVEYSFNGVPARKILAVRRKIGYTVQPSLAGSQVTISIDEELEQVDLKTGESEGWKSVEPDAASYDALTRKLREKLRSL